MEPSACRPCTSEACGPGRSPALAASVLWAAHNCIGPYLLAHYTWVGRGRSLARAVSAAAALTAAILAAALACLLLLTPAAYDYGQVRSSFHRGASQAWPFFLGEDLEK